MENKIRISKEEMKHIKSSLSWGRKKNLASFMGISQSKLSGILKAKILYSVQEKSSVRVYEMCQHEYDKINQFINSIKE